MLEPTPVILVVCLCDRVTCREGCVVSVLKERSIWLSNMNKAVFVASVWDIAGTVIAPRITGLRYRSQLSLDDKNNVMSK